MIWYKPSWKLRMCTERQPHLSDVLYSVPMQWIVPFRVASQSENCTTPVDTDDQLWRQIVEWFDRQNSRKQTAKIFGIPTERRFVTRPSHSNRQVTEKTEKKSPKYYRKLKFVSIKLRYTVHLKQQRADRYDAVYHIKKHNKTVGIRETQCEAIKIGSFELLKWFWVLAQKHNFFTSK